MNYYKRKKWNQQKHKILILKSSLKNVTCVQQIVK